MAVLCVAGGTGVLYLLRSRHALAAGPNVSGALPLQQLNGDEAQALARVLAAYVPAGVMAGIALGGLARVRARVAAPVLAAVTLVLLVAAGASADAIANGLRVADRLEPQLGTGAPWVAAGCVLLGAALGIGLARRLLARPVPPGGLALDAVPVGSRRLGVAEEALGPEIPT